MHKRSRARKLLKYFSDGVGRDMLNWLCVCLCANGENIRGNEIIGH